MTKKQKGKQSRKKSKDARVRDWTKEQKKRGEIVEKLYRKPRGKKRRVFIGARITTNKNKKTRVRVIDERTYRAVNDYMDSLSLDDFITVAVAEGFSVHEAYVLWYQ